MGLFKVAQNAAFDSYDPNMFDPGLAGKHNNANGASTGGSAVNLIQTKAGQKLQFNVTLNNPSAVPLTIELFCYLFSYINVLKTQYVVGNYKYIPLLSLEGLTAHAGTHGGVIGFDKTGNLQIQGDPTVPEVAATVSCGQIPYQGLFTASGITPFTIAWVRYTCLTDEQIDQDINYFTRSYSGGQTNNPVTPRSYFQPNQFQNFTLDLPVEMGIDIQSGISTVVLAGENLRLSFFVSIYADMVSQ